MRRLGGCKLRARFALEAPELGEALEALGELHPRGCMGARESHVDIDALSWGPLGDAVRVRGARVSCVNGPGYVVLRGGPLSTFIRVRPLEPPGLRLRCPRSQAYIMATRRGMLYIAPVVWTTGSQEGNPKTPRSRERSGRRPRKRRA